MLCQLVIRNFAIIDDLSVSFGSGLNALTGETGAGKSILIVALGMVLGGRADAAAVRTGAAKATIDAEFHVEHDRDGRIAVLLEELGIDCSELLLLTREIQPAGRSVARINGRPVTVAALSSVGAALVDIHGQSDHLSLLNRNRQREILDEWGVDQQLVSRVSELVRQWKSTLAALDSVSRNARETAQRVDLLTFQLDEIDAAQPVAGEDIELEQEFSRLSQIDKLSAEVQLALSLIDSSDAEAGVETSSVAVSLRLADRALTIVSEIDGSLTPAADQLREAQFALDDVALSLRRYLDNLEADPGRLTVVADRIARLRDLKRKYGASLDEVLRFRAETAAELEALTGAGHDEESLRIKAVEQEQELTGALESLTSARRHAASTLKDAVQGVIHDLQLGGASFSVAVSSRVLAGEPLNPSSVDKHGADDIKFMFAPNEGEEPKPLARIASGGEMARVMLALKATLAGSDDIPTYVFDEVDVGVGGRSGATVGEKLYQLSRDRQVLVISHLPQVAGFADLHFRISKQVDQGRTHSVVEQLDDHERIEELAAMFDGEPPTPASRANAREMLERIGQVQSQFAK